MMLGYPVTSKAQAFGMSRKVSSIDEGGGDVTAFNDRDEIEQGEFGHIA